MAGGSTTSTTAPGATTTSTTVVDGSSTTSTTVVDGSSTTSTTIVDATTTTTPGGVAPTTTSPGATPSTVPDGGTPEAPPQLQILLSAPPGVELPPVVELELFLTTGTANERVVLTVFTKNFVVPEPYSASPLFTLPETGVERWTVRQIYGFGFILFGMGLLMLGATRRLRRL